jgi:hypothetical protein
MTGANAFVRRTNTEKKADWPRRRRKEGEKGGRELFKKEPEDISQSLCDISSG